MSSAEISLRVPGKQEYVLVIRTALGGVAVLKDLNVDALDDLRMATDEACDCLLHQGRSVASISLSVSDLGKSLTVSLEADFEGECQEACEDITAMCKAVLETLVPQVEMSQCACGCIKRIDMTFPKAM